MYIIPERLIADLVSAEDAFDAMRGCFAAMADGDAYNFPVIREALGEGRQYGFKSGFDRAGAVMGVKSGGYFPGNAARGLINHQSCVLLFDPETGRPTAMVGGNLLTALRTAAASALSIDQLARPDAQVLGMVGAGHQSAFQLRAALRVRKFTRVLGWNRNPDRLSRLAEVCAEAGVEFTPVDLAAMQEADVIITITSSNAASLLADHVRAGCHISAMGTDTIGKQEIDPALFARAAVFTDEVAQSVTIGEAQHAVAQGLIGREDITPLGAVVTGAAKGRVSPDQITIFDGTGVGLQDLAVAQTALSRARAQGLGAEVVF